MTRASFCGLKTDLVYLLQWSFVSEMELHFTGRLWTLRERLGDHVMTSDKVQEL